MGPFGVAASRAAYPQPWFDEHGGIFPVFHALRGLAKLKGHTMHALELSEAGAISGIAVRTDESKTIFWIANKSPDPVTIRIEGTGGVELAVLSAETFTASTAASDFMDRMAPHDEKVTLDAFAVLRIERKN